MYDDAQGIYLDLDIFRSVSPRGALIFEFDRHVVRHVLEIHSAPTRAIQDSKPGSGDLQMRSLAQLTTCDALGSHLGLLQALVAVLQPRREAKPSKVVKGTP